MNNCKEEDLRIQQEKEREANATEEAQHPMVSKDCQEIIALTTKFGSVSAKQHVDRFKISLLPMKSITKSLFRMIGQIFSGLERKEKLKIARDYITGAVGVRSVKMINFIT